MSTTTQLDARKSVVDAIHALCTALRDLARAGYLPKDQERCSVVAKARPQDDAAAYTITVREDGAATLGHMEYSDIDLCSHSLEHVPFPELLAVLGALYRLDVWLSDLPRRNAAPPPKTGQFVPRTSHNLAEPGPATEYSVCQNCGDVWPDSDLAAIKGLEQRVAPGEPVPSGECPGEECCGALCQPIAFTPEDYSWWRWLNNTHSTDVTLKNFEQLRKEARARGVGPGG